MLAFTRRDFVRFIGAGVAVVGTPRLLALDRQKAIKKALAKRDRAVLVHDNWVRDPYVALGKDGWYYYTGTMQSPSFVENEETRNNTGLGTSTMVSSMVRLYRSRDLVNWEGGVRSTPWRIRPTTKNSLQSMTRHRRRDGISGHPSYISAKMAVGQSSSQCRSR